MIRVGIIGCGRIADAHAVEIKKIRGCEIVGVCDKEILMAKQLAERFRAQKYFADLHDFFEVARPDVVHITTPPQSHFELGKLCLEAGCHVFLEKPFTINTAEAENLIKLATDKNLKLTVGHNAQFSHAAMRMRELIHSGYLGGAPVHMESIWCYPFTDAGYAKAILGDSNHWIRSLPGKYLQDILAHGISRIAEFLESSNPTVIAHGLVSPLLKSIGEDDIIDELRVIINDNDRRTAYFTFSSQITPPIKQFRIYGPRNSLIVDHEHQTVIKVSKNYTYYLNHFISPLVDAKQYFSSSVTNIKKFIKKDFYFESGRKYLIEAFYRAISQSSSLPISYREILLTSRIMDDIFKQVYGR
jgi:predicted dehydrogenase